VGELDFLRDLVVVFGVSIGIVYAFDKLRVPALVGFLVAGTLIGPYGLNIVRDISRVEVFAEIGIVLLLFTIGVEFSLAHIRSFRSAVGGGLLQIGLAILLSAAVGLGAGLPVNQAVLWGFLTAMSSTAIVFKMLSERNETTSPHGMLATGVLIVQDLAVVPMMVLVPVLSLQREAPVDERLGRGAQMGAAEAPQGPRRDADGTGVKVQLPVFGQVRFHQMAKQSQATILL